MSEALISIPDFAAMATARGFRESGPTLYQLEHASLHGRSFDAPERRSILSCSRSMLWHGWDVFNPDREGYWVRERNGRTEAVGVTFGAWGGSAVWVEPNGTVDATLSIPHGGDLDAAWARIEEVLDVTKPTAAEPPFLTRRYTTAEMPRRLACPRGDHRDDHLPSFSVVDLIGAAKESEHVDLLDSGLWLLCRDRIDIYERVANQEFARAMDVLTPNEEAAAWRDTRNATAAYGDLNDCRLGISVRRWPGDVPADIQAAYVAGEITGAERDARRTAAYEAQSAAYQAAHVRHGRLVGIADGLIRDARLAGRYVHAAALSLIAAAIDPAGYEIADRAAQPSILGEYWLTPVGLDVPQAAARLEATISFASEFPGVDPLASGVSPRYRELLLEARVRQAARLHDMLT